MHDKEYMERAIELAKKGAGWTSPNPLVGAVIVKEDRVIGEGYHKRYGGLHAEREAFSSLKESAKGATIYVTLEPCCHHGHQPPCTDAIIEHGISRVVIGSRDPNPLVSGKGAAILKEKGIEVVEDFMRKECDKLNPIFFHFIKTRLPFVTTKYAMTLDGKIATKTGASKWITSEKAREHVHKLRGRYSAIMAGIGTVLADDPMLNCRLEGAHQPVRIIVDSSLRLPLDSQIVKTANEYRTIVAHANSQGVESVENRVSQGNSVADDNTLQTQENCVDDSTLKNQENCIDDNTLQNQENCVDDNTLKNQGKSADDNTLQNQGNSAADEMNGVSLRKSADNVKNEISNEKLNVKKEVLEKNGVEVWELPGEEGRVDLWKLIQKIGEAGIDSILIEGGGELHESALREGIVNHICAYVAPKIFGGAMAKSPVEGIGVDEPGEGALLENLNITILGEDILLEYDVKGGMKGVYRNC